MEIGLRIVGLSILASLVLNRYSSEIFSGIWTTTILLTLVGSVAYFVHSVILYPRFFSPIRHLPQTPNPEFLLNQSKRIFNAPTGFPQTEWMTTAPNDGLIRYSLWFQEQIFLTTPAALCEVLVTKSYDFVKSASFRNFMQPILGIGIVLAEGDRHKRQRKELMPVFSLRHTKGLYPTFCQKAGEMVHLVASSLREAQNVEHHQSQANGSLPLHEPGVVNISAWAARVTLDIIGLSAMGRDFNALRDPESTLRKMYDTALRPGKAGRYLSIAGNFLPTGFLRRLPLKRNRAVASAAAYIRQTCRGLVRKMREMLKEEVAREDVDILSFAMKTAAFDDEELVDQMMTFLGAGHETTASAFVWAVYLLCKHPDAQNRLREEVRSKISCLESEVSWQEIESCCYLQAFCSEVLRLWPPAVIIRRVADRDTSINGQFIPKGMTIVMCPQAINLSRDLWGPDAREFKPERWLNADGKANSHGSATSNYAFLTFLHGPRNCIGQRFAQSEVACLLAAWVGRFQTRFEEGSALAAGGDVEIENGATANPKGGLWCHVEALSGW